ncbi:Conserved hypothetical protein [Neisseria gonorrhoeae NCCP11945]|uniref:Uncharacterized protein n=1 Tax=Neisseria gonorrhoeae (strain NCCP11945) TaxID=521006 RepID=B4RLJ5_NEIG2|nr:Conserved hypothetical protein [Neisseria gonorrhoeae NCCP11945]
MLEAESYMGGGCGCGGFPFYSGLTKTGTALPRPGSKGTVP